MQATWLSVWPRHGVLGFGTIYSSATLGNSLIYFHSHIEVSTEKFQWTALKFQLEIVNFLHNLSAMRMTAIFNTISTDFYSNILTIWEHGDNTVQKLNIITVLKWKTWKVHLMTFVIGSRWFEVTGSFPRVLLLRTMMEIVIMLCNVKFYQEN